MLLSFGIACCLAAVVKATPLEGRETCDRDNLLRCFSATPSAASSYCSSYLQGPPTSTKTTTITFTTVTAIIKQTTTTFTDVITSYVSIEPKKAKRQEPATAIPAAQTGLTCLTKDGSTSTSYPASRISSACSCIGITSAPGRVTTKTVTKPTTVSTTYTSTGYEEILSTTTTTITCGEGPIPTTGAYYQRFYVGSGFDEDDNNEANQDPKHQAPDPEIYPANTPICDALNQCASFAAVKPRYSSWKLVKRASGYTCKIYYYRLQTARYWTIKDHTVIKAWGYSI